MWRICIATCLRIVIIPITLILQFVKRILANRVTFYIFEIYQTLRIMNATEIKDEFVNRFGDAYHDFGLPVLMGRIVGLLLYNEGPISLDMMTGELEVSKGPVSQILRRLRDHRLVKRVWVGGDRKDYYQVVNHVFLQAFINQAELLKRNQILAQDFDRKLKNSKEPELAHLKSRIKEMVNFNNEMQEYLNKFIEKWRDENTE